MVAIAAYGPLAFPVPSSISVLRRGLEWEHPGAEEFAADAVAHTALQGLQPVVVLYSEDFLQRLAARPSSDWVGLYTWVSAISW